jgi:hypothetical protein
MLTVSLHSSQSHASQSHAGPSHAGPSHASPSHQPSQASTTEVPSQLSIERIMPSPASTVTISSQGSVEVVSEYECIDYNAEFRIPRRGPIYDQDEFNKLLRVTKVRRLLLHMFFDH